MGTASSNITVTQKEGTCDARSSASTIATDTTMEGTTIKHDRNEGAAVDATIETELSDTKDVAVKEERVRSELDALSHRGPRHVKQEPNTFIIIEDDDDDDHEIQITSTTSKESRRKEVINAAKRKDIVELNDDEGDAPTSPEAKRLKTELQDCDVCNHAFRRSDLRSTYLRQEQEQVCRGCYNGLVALQNSKWNEIKDRNRPPEEKECTICLEKLEAWQFPKPRHAEAYGCGGGVCRICWRDHLESEVNSKDVDLVQCPSCVYVLESDEMRVLATDETYDLWTLKAAKAYVEKDAEYRSCPLANCKFVGLFTPNEKYNLFVCPECNYRYCVDCAVPFHNGETCEQYRARRKEEEQDKVEAAEAASKRAQDDRLTQEEVNRSSKPCPKCGIQCQKISGCDHVVCLRPACRHQFNWSSA